MQNNDFRNIVFLDRDGVINRDSPAYVKTWTEFHFLPGSLAALKRLHEHQFQTVVVTNQSAVARGMMSPRELEDMHAKMKTAIHAGGGSLLDIFHCPHLPQDGCSCRKPKPGLVLAARAKYRLSLSRTYLVGDSAKDIECARRAGCGSALLVKTGNFEEAQRTLAKRHVKPDFIARDLFHAVGWIIAHSRQSKRS